MVYPPSLLARHSFRSCQKWASAAGITCGRLMPRAFEHITETQWSYFAGIIDGEGTIRNYQFPNGHWQRGVSFSNTHRPLIDWAFATFPGAGIHTREKGDKWQTCYQIVWSRTGLLAELLEGIMPHLIVKRDKAEALLVNLSKSRFSTLT